MAAHSGQKQNKLGGLKETLSTQRRWKCRLCDTSFDGFFALHEHRRKCSLHQLQCRVVKKHKMATHSGQKQNKLGGLKETLSNQMRWKCSLCDRFFDGFFALNEHRQIHRGKTPWKCECCGKSFWTSTHLTQHKRVHSGENPYECDICGKSFVLLQSWDKHRSSRHGEKQSDKYNSNGTWRPKEICKCDVCDRAFQSLQRLAQHKMIHTGQNTLKCKYCKWSFRHRSVLKEHEMRHSGEKPFKCEICGNGFIRFALLKQHRIRKHRYQTPEKTMFKCEHCGKSFAKRWERNKHYRRKIPCTVLRTELTFDESCVFVVHETVNDPGCQNWTGPKKEILPIKSVSTEKWNNSAQPNKHELPDTCVNAISSHNIWKCDYCDSVFPQPNELSVHTLLKHIEHVQDNAFKCDW